MTKELRTSGVFSLGALGGDTGASGDANWSDVVLLLDGDNNLTDRSGNTSMAWSGSAGYNSGGKHGAALSFGASGTHVQGPTGANTSSFQFGTDPFTIETWIYLNATPSGDDFIFCPRGSYLDTSSFVWFVVASGSNAQLRMYSYNSFWYASSSTFAPQTWTHIAVTRDTNKHFKFYIDGQLIDTLTNQTSRVMAHTSTAPLRIGNGEGDTQGINGLLDDFRVTKGVARDIAADWTAGVYNSALPQGAAVAAATRPTRRWGGMTGRSLVETTSGGASSASIDYLVIAGGGGGGKGQTGSYVEWGGGGGAGGYLTSWGGSTGTETSGGGAQRGNALSYSSGDTFTVTVGTGGAGSSTTATKGTSGSSSQFGSVIAAGGGGGGYLDGRSGGSGGGASSMQQTAYSGGSASPAGQGNAGGSVSAAGLSAGGGGAGGAGTTTSTLYQGGTGGAGLASTITGASVVRAGGGGGASFQATPGIGGSGGGGYGSRSDYSGGVTFTTAATDGTVNTGSGGGGDSHYHSSNTGGDGGDGVVILRMPTSVTLTSSNITVPAPQTVGTDEHYYAFTSGSGTVAVNIAAPPTTLATTGVLSLAEHYQRKL